MSKHTASNFFIGPSALALYQQLLSGLGTYEELGSKVVNQIKLCHSFRQTEQVRELSQILISSPIKEYRLIGEYYSLWCGCRENEYHSSILEQVIEQSQTYKTKALQSRAAFEVYQGNFTEALYFYTQALKTNPTISEYMETTKAIAYIKSVEGFHESALKDLENLTPILRHAEPYAYYDILNSLAVELGEASRKEEARNICRVVLASPFAYAYPEWQDTANDLGESQKPCVAVNLSGHVSHNVLFMPATKFSDRAASFGEPARVVDLQMWKNKMGKGKNGNGEKPNGDLKAQEMLMRIMQFYVSNNTTDEQRRKIYEYALKVLSEPAEIGEPDDAEDDKSGA